MSQHQGQHPRKFVHCPECGAAAPDTWETKRNLPQIDQTYECADCEYEVYVYDAGGKNEIIKQWRPVTDSMATSLLFFAEVGEWPDQKLESLFKQGLERAEAIDYQMTEIEGLSQTKWAEQTERQQPSVSENVSKARDKLNE